MSYFITSDFTLQKQWLFSIWDEWDFTPFNAFSVCQVEKKPPDEMNLRSWFQLPMRYRMEGLLFSKWVHSIVDL